MKQTYTFKILYNKKTEIEKTPKLVTEIFENVVLYGWGIEKFFFMQQHGELLEYKGNKDVAGKYTAKMIWIPASDIVSLTGIDEKTFSKRQEVFDFKKSDSFK